MPHTWIRIRTKPCASTGSQSHWVESDVKVSAFVPIRSHVRYWLRDSGNMPCDYSELLCKVGCFQTIKYQGGYYTMMPVAKKLSIYEHAFIFLLIIHSYLLLKGRTRTKAMGISIPWSAFFTDKLFHSLVCNVKYSNLLCKENIKKLTTHVTGIVLFGIINYSTLFDVITRWPLFGSMSWRWYSANHNVPLWYATTYIIFIYI